MINKPPKVLVIGIDRATFDLIESWCQEERLPNLTEMSMDCSPKTGPVLVRV